MTRLGSTVPPSKRKKRRDAYGREVVDLPAGPNGVTAAIPSAEVAAFDADPANAPAAVLARARTAARENLDPFNNGNIRARQLGDRQRAERLAAAEAARRTRLEGVAQGMTPQQAVNAGDGTGLTPAAYIARQRTIADTGMLPDEQMVMGVASAEAATEQAKIDAAQRAALDERKFVADQNEADRQVKREGIRAGLAQTDREQQGATERAQMEAEYDAANAPMDEARRDQLEIDFINGDEAAGAELAGAGRTPRSRDGSAPATPSLSPESVARGRAARELDNMVRTQEAIVTAMAPRVGSPNGVDATNFQNAVDKLNEMRRERAKLTLGQYAYLLDGSAAGQVGMPDKPAPYGYDTNTAAQNRANPMAPAAPITPSGAAAGAWGVMARPDAPAAPAFRPPTGAIQIRNPQTGEEGWRLPDGRSVRLDGSPIQ